MSVNEWVLAPEDWQQMLIESKLYHVERELQELIEEQVEDYEAAF